MPASGCPSFFTAAPMRRREFLRAGSVPLLGLTLPQLLHAREAAPATPRGKAKACIVLFMWGGPAHQDTWDPKPDAPAEFRGEFKPIATAVPGLHVCEHLPKLAARAGKLAVLRSMTHGDVDHTSATHFLLTGRDRPNRSAPLNEDWPNYGAVLAHLGRGKGPLPHCFAQLEATITSRPIKTRSVLHDSASAAASPSGSLRPGSPGPLAPG